MAKMTEWRLAVETEAKVQSLSTTRVFPLSEWPPFS